MLSQAEPDQRVFAVWFKDLDRWDPASFRTIGWGWPDGTLRPIGTALDRKLLEIDIPKVDAPIIEKISFGGRVSLLDPGQRCKYKGRLFWADSGDLIYSKIRVKQGSLAVVPSSLPRLALSGEYPVYSIKKDVASGPYLELVLRSSAFQALLNAIAHGGGTKTRIHPSTFESLIVPLPDIADQRAIAARWERQRESVAEAERKVLKLEATALTDFCSQLGLGSTSQNSMPKAFAVHWPILARWSVSHNQALRDMVDLSRGKFPVVVLGDILTHVQYGTSEKANTLGKGTPVIRMNNIKDGVLDLRDMKHIELGEAERKRLLLYEGDILFNRTNSKELVGKCAVYHEAGEHVFASYLIRVRVDPKRANPDFVAFFLNSPLGRQQINALSRHIIGQANVNSEELRGLRLSLPLLKEQDRIVEGLRRARLKISKQRRIAKETEESGRREVEEMILGGRKQA